MTFPVNPSASRFAEDEENSDVARGNEHYVRLCYMHDGLGDSNTDNWHSVLLSSDI